MSFLTPRYVSQFTCTGGDCPDTCCSGLTVRLSQEDVVRLRRGPGTEAWRNAVEKEVQPPPPGVPEGTHAVLAHPDGECAFLDTDRLCLVHKELGPEGLNATCRDYPRQSRQIGESTEVWGSLGCPEMARLAFSDADALELIETEEGPPARLSQSPDVSRKAMLAMLHNDEQALSMRFGAIALALDAATSLEDLAESAEAVRLDPAAYEQTLASVGADNMLRSIIGRDCVMARRPASRHSRFLSLVDKAVFAQAPTAQDVTSFFTQRSENVKPELALVDDLVAQNIAFENDAVFARACSRYASWRWATQPPADVNAARVLWGRILLEVAAAELLMTAGASCQDGFQIIAREVVNVPDLDVLFDAYVAEQGLNTLQGQVGARPAAAAVESAEKPAQPASPT